MACSTHSLKCQTLFQHLLQCRHKYHLLLCIQQSSLNLYNKIFFFKHIWVLHNHTETYTLQFYSVLVLTVQNRQDNSWFFSISHFYSQQMFCEKLCIWKFGFDIKLFFSSVVTSLMSLYFWKIFIVLPKTELFMNLKNHI